MDKTLTCEVIKIEKNKKYTINELLVCEYALTINLNKRKIATLLCTPENMKELVIGFLRVEELIMKVEDITDFRLDIARAVVEIETKQENIEKTQFHSKKVDAYIQKDQEVQKLSEIINCVPVESHVVLDGEKIYAFMKENLTHSDIFKKTGGVHSVGLADTEKLMYICEDVARHNAMDKVIGKAMIERVSLTDKIIVLSGRVSFEMLLKAAKMQIPIVVSKSAPTNLSVEVARKLNITLVGFVRGEKMNIYANEYRVK